jgi:hypothetical protein
MDLDQSVGAPSYRREIPTAVSCRTRAQGAPTVGQLGALAHDPAGSGSEMQAGSVAYSTR